MEFQLSPGLNTTARNHLLNFKSSTGFSVLSFGNCVTEIFMSCRAFGGRIARNMRAVFAR
jgi:hypothetical protein